MSKQKLDRIVATRWDFMEVAITREMAAWMPRIGDVSNDEQMQILLENILWEYKELILRAQALQANMLDLESRSRGSDGMDRDEYFETLEAIHDNIR